MIEVTAQIDDPSGVVTKLVFEGDGGAIAEAVAYRYDNRGVVCFSVQSGCPVGCRFCGTGNRFIRDLTASEMLAQIDACLRIVGPREKVQVMSMSMGDPMLNWPAVKAASEEVLDAGASFYISTVGFDMNLVLRSILEHSKKHCRFGVQFSLHHTDERKRLAMFRNRDLPYLGIKDLLWYAKAWTGTASKYGMPSLLGRRLAYFNYIAKGNETHEQIAWLADNLNGMHLTCSVMCDTGDMVKGDTGPAERLAEAVLEASGGHVEVSTFDPAGQDTVGGGCGQLLYVQERLNGTAGAD